jgi:hypothetical protein
MAVIIMAPLPSQLNGNKKEDKKRKYQPAWEIIKSSGMVILSIEGASTMSVSQRESAFQTIRKAIIKEKHEDWVFKRANPKMQLDIVGLEEFRKLCAKLIEKPDPKVMFD